MQTIKTFNETLNQSDEERFLLWKEYREQLTKFIISYLNPTNKDALILGAGNADDIDLSLLQSHCHMIYLSDVDEKALSSAMNTYHLSKDLVTLLPAEYTGLDDHLLWKDFIHEALKVKNERDVDQLIDTYKNIIINHTFLPDYIQQFDQIIISPIYTQLLFHHFETSLQFLKELHYPIRFIDLFRQSFLNMMTVVIDAFNKNVVRLLKEKGQVFVISDIFESTKGSEFFENIRTLINRPIHMDKFYLEYQNTHGTGLGDYGLLNMNDYLTPQLSEWLVWPFTDERRLIVKVVLYQND